MTSQQYYCGFTATPVKKEIRLRQGTVANDNLVEQKREDNGSVTLTLSNITCLLWGYRSDNSRGMLGEHEKTL